MRTTLTIDDDLARDIEELRRERRASLKAVVNEALRLGLGDLRRGQRRGRRYKMRTFDLGECKLPSLDNVAEVLAWAEGDDHR